MRKWLEERYGLDAPEAGWMIGITVLIVVLFVVFVLRIWMTGGDVTMALMSFLIGVILSLAISPRR